MTKPLAFLATYADWKLIKTRACVQIVFEVPLEKANEAYDLLGGMPVAATENWFAIARLDPSKIAGDAPAREAESSKAAPPASASRLTTRSVMLAKEPMFRRFVEIETKAPMGEVTEEAATEYIRSTCQVESRSEIQPGTVAADRFAFILSAYTRFGGKRDRYVTSVSAHANRVAHIWIS